MSVNIRFARLDDAPALLDIYKPYVEKTNITAEYNVPSLEEFRQRIKAVLKDYPYLVAEEHADKPLTDNLSSDTSSSSQGTHANPLLGYMYVAEFNDREAYQWAVETSIYVNSQARHQGVGKMLEQCMHHILCLQNVTNMYACIGVPSVKDDPYITTNSHDFHAHIGYTEVAHLHKANYKFGRWNDITLMEKIIGEHKKEMPDFIPFPQIRGQAQKILDSANDANQNVRS